MHIGKLHVCILCYTCLILFSYIVLQHDSCSDCVDLLNATPISLPAESFKQVAASLAEHPEVPVTNMLTSGQTVGLRSGTNNVDHNPCKHH